MANILALPHYLRPEPKPKPTPEKMYVLKVGPWLRSYMHVRSIQRVAQYFDPDWVESMSLPAYFMLMYGIDSQDTTKPQYLMALKYINAVGHEKFIDFTSRLHDQYITFEALKDLCEYLLLADRNALLTWRPEKVMDYTERFIRMAMERRYNQIRKEHEFAEAAAASPFVYGCPA